MTNIHPEQALFDGEKAFPTIPSCEHFAGSERLIGRAFHLQDQLGPIFDITCDCEDGAVAGQERVHAEMVARMIASPENTFKQTSVRIHDPSHQHWRRVLTG